MSNGTTPSIDRLYALLADRAVQQLTAEETEELESLLSRWPHVQMTDLDIAAAACDRAFARHSQAELPKDLAERILSDAPKHLPALAKSVQHEPQSQPWRVAAIVGWAVAASVLTFVIGWYSLNRSTGTQSPADFATLARDPGSIRYVSTKTDAKSTGEIVWHAQQQLGYLKITGLAVNKPQEQQYQLWIVDGGRTDPNHQQPIDGGVFDVGPDGTALVPIRAALRVRDAKAFAVTSEQAGGVVVSRGPHLIVMTPANGG